MALPLPLAQHTQGKRSVVKPPEGVRGLIGQFVAHYLMVRDQLPEEQRWEKSTLPVRSRASAPRA